MHWCRYLLVCAVLAAGALPAEAGLFGKKKKPDPVQRVPELVQVLKADKDDRKRASAAEELRQYDPAQFPQIVPVLIETLQTDPKPSVRVEAAHSLGKLRPVSVPAGQALEKAASADAALRVRFQARKELMFYHVAGYSAPKKGEPPPAVKGPRTDEPPLAVPAPMPPPGQTAPPPLAPPGAQTPPPPAPPPQTAEPPQQSPAPMPPAPPSSSQYQPLPSGPSQAPAAPAPMSPEVDGPILTPPPQ